MHRFVPLAVLALAGCNTPSTDFLGVDPVRVTVEGWEIDVFATEKAAQAVRATHDWGATGALMTERGAVAIREVTGCARIAPYGAVDPSILTAKLSCRLPDVVPSQPGPPLPSPSQPPLSAATRSVSQPAW